MISERESKPIHCDNCGKDYKIKPFIPKNKNGDIMFNINVWFFAYCSCGCGDFIFSKKDLKSKGFEEES